MLPYPPILSHEYLISRAGRFLFYLDQPHIPPEILLGKGEEMLISLHSLKSLKSWDLRRARSLTDIVTDLYTQYKDRQKAAVLGFASERIQFEVSLVQDRAGTEFLLTESLEHGPEVAISL